MPDSSDRPPSNPEQPKRRRRSLTRNELGSRLAYWPLLRLLLFDWRFRWALALAILVFALAAVGLPRLWRVTPDDFNPVVRISALDWFQARHFGRKAAACDTAGERELATANWRLAIANNPGSAALVRGSLSNLLAQPPRHVGRFNQAVQQMFWLLQLTHTNRVDLGLAIRVCEHFSLDDLLVGLVRQAPPPAAPAEEVAVLMALVRQGQAAQYARLRAGLTNLLPAGEPGLALHHAAWQAGWGDAVEAAAGRAALSAAEGDPAQRVPALRLELLADAVRNRADDYGAALARLRDLHADEPLNHVGYWLLLRSAGRTNEAVVAAKAYTDPPVTAQEVARQAQALVALGLSEDATRFLERFAVQLGGAGNAWAAYARLLIDQRKWRELRTLAFQIRQTDSARMALAGYSWYLEGRAQHEMGNDVEAAAALASVPQFPLRDPGLVLDTARQMGALGSWAPARDLLLGREAELGRNPDYWRQILRAAWELRDADLVRRAAEALYRLAPDSPAAQNDLAAALLVQNVENDRALELTGRLLRRDPTSLPALVNHACALIRNGQTAAARALVLSVDEARLDGVSRNALNFVQAEMAAALAQPAETLAAVARLDTNLLMAPQLVRVEELRTRARAGFPPTPAGTSNPR